MYGFVRSPGSLLDQAQAECFYEIDWSTEKVGIDDYYVVLDFINIGNTFKYLIDDIDIVSSRFRVLLDTKTVLPENTNEENLLR